MDLYIKLGKSKTSKEFKLTVPSSDSSVADAIEKLRSELPQHVQRVLSISEIFGSEVFLAPSPDGPKALDKNKSLSECELSDGTVLWLMCAHRVAE